MAMVSSSESKSGRSFNHELPLVPFIDFLLCLLAFLLVTAVLGDEARLRADAEVPAPNPGPPAPLAKVLHVAVGDHDFELAWKQGATVLDSERVPRKGIVEGDGTVRYPELGAAIERKWKAQGLHRAENDHALDRAVLHAENELEFAEVVAALDQIMAPKRQLCGPRGSHESSAFAVSFASD